MGGGAGAHALCLAKLRGCRVRRAWGKECTWGVPELSGRDRPVKPNHQRSRREVHDAMQQVSGLELEKAQLYQHQLLSAL